MKKFNTWLDEIDESDKKQTSIDMAKEFERLFSRNIITISLGEDISDNYIKMVKINLDGTTSEEDCSVREAIHIILD